MPCDLSCRVSSLDHLFVPSGPCDILPTALSQCLCLRCHSSCVVSFLFSPAHLVPGAMAVQKRFSCIGSVECQSLAYMPDAGVSQRWVLFCGGLFSCDVWSSFVFDWVLSQ